MTCSALANCYASGIGPQCYKSLNSGSPNGNTSQPADLGNKQKEKCVNDKLKAHAKSLQDCICACITGGKYSGFQDNKPSKGLEAGCWGECIDKNGPSFVECYCNEMTCSGQDSGGGTGSGPGNGDGAIGNGGGGGGGGGGAPLPPTIRYEDAQLGPKIRTVNFTSSTYEAVLPIVYNRGIMHGNVIWAGEPRVQTKTVVTTTVVDKQVTVTTTEVTQTFMDFALALCEGETKGITRLWINDILLYNNTLRLDAAGFVLPTNGVYFTTLANLGVFNRTDDDVDLFDATAMEVIFYPGSEDQSIDPTMKAAYGSATPAFRGLSYIVFKNFEITRFSGSVPIIKVEVVRTVSNVRPKQLSSLVNGTQSLVKSDLLWVDPIDRRIYVGGSATSPSVQDGIRSIDYDSLSEIDQYEAPTTGSSSEAFDHTTFALSAGGTILVQTGAVTNSRPLASVLSGTNYQLASYGSHTADVENTASNLANYGRVGGHGGALVTLREADGQLRPHFVVPSDNDLAFFRLGPLGTEAKRVYVGSFMNTTPDVIRRVLPLSRAVIIEEGQGPVTTQYHNFYLLTSPALVMNAITIRRAAAYDTGLNPVFNAAQGTDNFVIPASIWGGQTTGTTIATAFTDARYESIYIVLQFSNGKGSIVCWSINTESVTWESAIMSPPPYNSAGPRTSPTASPTYSWIGGDSVLYTADKKTGTVTVSSNIVTGHMLPAIGGAQYFDGGSQSVTYITATNQVARAYIGRSFVGSTPLSGALADLFSRADLETHDYDIATLDVIGVDGYVVHMQTSVRNVLAQLGVIYNFFTRQRGSQIACTPNGVESGLFLSINNISASGEGVTIERTERTDVNRYKTARVKYYDIDQAMTENIQVVTSAVPPENNNANTGDIIIDYPLASTALFALSLAERILFDALVNTEQFNVHAGMASIRLEPGDYVTIFTTDLAPQKYRIEVSVIGADFTNDLTLVRDDKEGYESSPALLVQDPLIKNDGLSQDFLPTSKVRPVVMLTNAIIPAHASVLYESLTGAYVGISFTGTTFVPTKVYLGPVGGLRSSVGVVQAPLNWGTLLSSLSPPQGIYATDATTELIVRFSAPGAVDFMLPNASTADLFADHGFGRNVLFINEELVQVLTVAVDPDGLTYRFRGLLRGRHGTEPVAGGHAVGDFVALYTAESFLFVERQRVDGVGDLLSASVQYGIPSAQTFLDQPFLTDHDILKFYSPSNLRRSTLTNGDSLFAFNYRSRKGNPVDDLANIEPLDIPQVSTFAAVLSSPYDEALFLAEFSNLSSSYIKRRFTGSFSFFYSVAQQTADGNAAGPVHVVACLTRSTGDTLFPVPLGHVIYESFYAGENP